MKCQRCGNGLLPVVELSVQMGGPQVCGPCIDQENNCRHGTVEEYPTGVHACVRCGKAFTEEELENIP